MPTDYGLKGDRMTNYRLTIDGDGLEQHYWKLFIQSEFPSYEKFWEKHVIPLSNRPVDIHFKTNAQLSSSNLTQEDVCIAQLHYSLLRHLSRVFEYRGMNHTVDLDILTEAFARLTSAQDVAFELLERYTNKSIYDPWLEQGDRKTGTKGGEEARRAWQGKDNGPLKDIRQYRNHLIHGRFMPGVYSGVVYLPKIGKEQNYLDWRLITDRANNPGMDANDFDDARQILDLAWRETLQYIEQKWQTHLLP